MNLVTPRLAFNCFIGLGKYYRTAKGNPPVTFAIAACESQNVSVTVLPSFGLSEGSRITAKDMWGGMVEVAICFFFLLAKKLLSLFLLGVGCYLCFVLPLA